MKRDIGYLIKAISYDDDGSDTRYYNYHSLYTSLTNVLLYSHRESRNYMIALYAMDWFRHRYIVDSEKYYINHPALGGEIILFGKEIRSTLRVDYIDGSRVLMVPLSRGKDRTINIESTDGIIEIGYYNPNQSVFGIELLNGDLIEEYDMQIKNKFIRADRDASVILIDGDINRITVGDII